MTCGMLASLTGLDLWIVALAVAMLPVISWIFGRKESDTSDFFLGSRKIPSIVACLSFVAAEISALTIIGVPATAYSENWQYLQFFAGSAAARIVVMFLFIPLFYQYNCTSIYEYLRHRFGPQTQYTGSVFFFVTRLMASGVRLYAACMGVGIIMGWSLKYTIVFFSIVSILFIAFGGIKAVVWAGAWQAIIFIGAGIVMLVYLLSQTQGSLAFAIHMADSAGRLDVFDFSFKLNQPTSFWAGTANAFFIGLAVFGTDQELVQRLLTVETRRKSQTTIFMTIILGLPVLCIYLAIGTGLYIFFRQHPDITGPAQAKEVMSYFITNFLPTGLKGLLLSAIILASIDSPLSSLSSSFVSDIYRTIIRKGASEKHYLLVSRAAIIVFGLILALIALACAPIKNILWFAFEIFSVTGGATLGVFLLGILTKTKANYANVIAMITSTIAMAVLLLLKKYEIITLAWSWLIVLGTITTMLLSFTLSMINKAKNFLDENIRIQRIKKAVGDFKQKLVGFGRYYYFVKCNNEMLEVYFKCLLRSTKRCSISFDSIKAIYAGDSEFCFNIEIYLKGNKRLFLSRPLFPTDSGSVENWDELVSILAGKCLHFNMNNLEQADRVEMPFLCWHSEKEVPNIRVVTSKNDISVVWQETGEEYSFDDYLAMIKNCKNI